MLAVGGNPYPEEMTVLLGSNWRKNEYREWREVISVSHLSVEMGFLKPLLYAFACGP